MRLATDAAATSFRDRKLLPRSMLRENSISRGGNSRNPALLRRRQRGCSKRPLTKVPPFWRNRARQTRAKETWTASLSFLRSRETAIVRLTAARMKSSIRDPARVQRKKTITAVPL